MSRGHKHCGSRGSPKIKFDFYQILFWGLDSDLSRVAEQKCFMDPVLLLMEQTQEYLCLVFSNCSSVLTGWKLLTISSGWYLSEILYIDKLKITFSTFTPKRSFTSSAASDLETSPIENSIHSNVTEKEHISLKKAYLHRLFEAFNNFAPNKPEYFIVVYSW